MFMYLPKCLVGAYYKLVHDRSDRFYTVQGPPEEETIAMMWIHEVTATCRDNGNYGACHENHTSAVPFAETTDFIKF